VALIRQGNKVHVTEAVLEPLRKRYGEPALLEWEGEISEQEHALATYDPNRMHDVTLFILNADRLALIRKPHFEQGVWRPPGGGVKAGEDFVEGVRREALEETGLEIELERYLVVAEARFLYEPHAVPWRTHVFLARTSGEELAPLDREEIADARWGTLDELAGPLRQRLLQTGHAFWRYRVALHDTALAALGVKPYAP
jgi:ADP-ribose pyrophosphatase YjhB (NUDIX family)